MPVPAGRAAWVQARVQAVPRTERPRCPSSGLGGGAGGAATGVPSPQCCQTLLSHRVDPALRDEDGYTAADLAEYTDFPFCKIKVLEMCCTTMCIYLPFCTV